MQIGIITHRTFNIGDDVQSLAASQILPYVDCFVRRDNYQIIGGAQTDTALLMSAFFKLKNDLWPPPDWVHPIFLGFHASFDVGRFYDYFKKHEPIGCRDEFTLQKFQKLGIESFFSGCVTLTYVPEQENVYDGRDIIGVPSPQKLSIPTFVDMNGVCRRGIPAFTPHDRIEVSHQLADANHAPVDRLYTVQKLMRLYHSSEFVLTTRLHAYLPSLAMGTPAILVGKPDGRTRSYLKNIDFDSLATNFRSKLAGKLDELGLNS